MLRNHFPEIAVPVAAMVKNESLTLLMALTTSSGVARAFDNLFADSNILDYGDSFLTDMAEEMVAFTRNQIMVQAGTAMLAQANQVPASVLSLLQ